MMEFWIYFIYSKWKNNRIKSDRLRAIYVSVTRCNLVQDLIANETRRDKTRIADTLQPSGFIPASTCFIFVVFRIKPRSIKPVDIKLSYFNRYTDTQQMRLNNGIMHQCAQVALWRILFDIDLATAVCCRNLSCPLFSFL